MFKVVLLALTILISFNSFGSNPQMRNCRINGGEFKALDLKTSQGEDSVGFCFFGEGSIGTLSLLEMINTGRDSDAITALKITEFGPVDSCAEIGSKEIRGNDSDNKLYRVCEFDDLSFMNLQTLRNGINAPVNNKLKNFLFSL